MPISIHWDNEEKTTLRWDFEGRWTWIEFYEAIEEDYALREETDHKINSVIYLGNSSTIPSGAPSQFHRLAKWSHPRAGKTVIVGANRFVEILVQIFSTVQRDIGKRIVMAKSLEEARELLKTAADQAKDS